MPCVMWPYMPGQACERDVPQHPTCRDSHVSMWCKSAYMTGQTCKGSRCWWRCMQASGLVHWLACDVCWSVGQLAGSLVGWLADWRDCLLLYHLQTAASKPITAQMYSDKPRNCCSQIWVDLATSAQAIQMMQTMCAIVGLLACNITFICLALM